jgi:hypothetical protein
MTVKRVRIVRIERREFDVTVKLPYPKLHVSNRDIPQELFEAALEAGCKPTVLQTYESLEQYGYVHPQDKPADFRIDISGTFPNS